MCEIKDYSVELKDIYNSKYSVSAFNVLLLGYNTF